MGTDANLRIDAHILGHIPELTVDPQLLTARFLAACATANCDAACCAGGVWVDIAHREAILARADLIVRYMGEGQERDASRWFDPQIRDDADFPSGKAAATADDGSACVFLNSEKRCVLHVVDAAEHLATPLKPFFCRIFPLTIVNGVLMLDEPASGERHHCCMPSPAGEATVFDVCAAEFDMALGRDGVAELLAHVKADKVASAGEPAHPDDSTG